MIAVRTLSESDLEAARRLYERFTGQDVSIDRFREEYAETPELFVGADDRDELVGICVGWPREGNQAELAGLGVEPSYRREGIGSRLVAAFEANALESGFERVSVASAGGYVDRFYAANGYAPVSVLVRIDSDEPPENFRETRFDVIEERIDGGTRKVYLDADDPDPAYLEAVREAFDDDEAVYIMEKALR